MSLPLTLTIILPLLGAAGTLLLSLVPRFRPYTRYVALTAVGLTTILILTLRWVEPVTVIPSVWQPSPLFGATLTLQNDAMMQPLAFVLALVSFGAVLVALSRAEGLHSRLAAALLALLSAGLVVLWAANSLTMIVSWAIYDLLQAAGHIAAGGSTRTAIRGFAFGSLATLLLWSGTTLPSGGASSQLWSLIEPDDVQLTLWAMAGILRLWVYPLHLATPDDLDTVPSPAVLLLLGPVIGWGLWLRLASANGGSIPGGTWVPTMAMATLAVGGFLAWSCRSPRSMLPWIGMVVTGAVLLAAGLAEESAAAVISTGSVAWALGVGVIFLSDGLQQESPWWNLPALVGALTLMGLPLTLGFVTEAVLIGGLTMEDPLRRRVAFFVGNLFLIPSLVRWLLSPSSASPPDTCRHHRPTAAVGALLVARGIGLGLPALLLIVAGFYPPLLVGSGLSLSLGKLFAMPSLAGWLLWAISLAGGGVLAWQEGNLRPRIEFLLSAAHDLLRLDWLYDAVAGALNRGLSVLRAADEVIRGTGALLWSWLLFLTFLLVWGGK